jgi:lysylphosphatidylglycerol synthetase-like protein (DUF2156 family)
MYQQVLDPVSGSLGSSAIFAVLPLATLFVLLGGLRMRAHWASLIALAVALLVAIVAYPMPVGQALDAAALGAVFGLFPIMWIVVNAIWLYNMTVKTGHFEVLRRSFGAVSPDQRVQAIVVAFSFGALLEALAGFGTPVAITPSCSSRSGSSRSRPPAWRSWPTPRPWPSARWPSRSSRSPRSRACRRRISAPWSGARPRSWP